MSRFAPGPRVEKHAHPVQKRLLTERLQQYTVGGPPGKRIGRGALIADYNLDGMVDILQVVRGSNVALFRNLGALNDGGDPLPTGNWTEIRLVQPNPNRNAVGAHIAVKTGTRTQVRTIEIGGGDASGHAGGVHVGLGTA